MTEKIRRHYTLHQSTILKIEELAKEKATSKSDIVDRSIASYYKEREEKYKEVKQMISDLLDEKLASTNETLKRIWLTGNVIDRHTQMLVEFWNYHFYIEEFIDETRIHDDLISREDSEAKPIELAEKLIKERINGKRNSKLERLEKQEQADAKS